MCVGTYLKEVHDWHGVMRKPVDEYSLKESLGIVKGPARSSNTERTCGRSKTKSSVCLSLLDYLGHGHLCSFAIDERRSGVEDEVGEQRAGIFRQEHLHT